MTRSSPSCRRRAAIWPRDEEKAKLEAAMWDCRKPPDHRDGGAVAAGGRRVAGFTIPDDRKFLIVKQDKIGKDHRFSGEKLTTLLAIYKYQGFDQALDMVRQIYEVGGKGHSVGIYSFNDDHIHRLALMAPVSRIMVRQPQSKANAGSFTNGMPMTSSLGCGIWGGNIISENVALKHFMQTTWVSRPIAGRPAVGRGAVRRVLQQRDILGFGAFGPVAGATTLSRKKQMTQGAVGKKVDSHATARHVAKPVPGAGRTGGEIIVACLEGLGVETIFGLCGHGVIGFMDALHGSKINLINFRHEQFAAHAADGYFRVTHRPGVVMTHLGPGMTNAITGVVNAALNSTAMVVIVGDIPSQHFGRDAHQEVKMHGDAAQFEIYQPFVKRAWRVQSVEALPRIVAEAFTIATSGRPGPVLIDVPMDMFSRRAEVEIPTLAKATVNVTRLRGDAAEIAGRRIFWSRPRRRRSMPAVGSSCRRPRPS